MEPRDLNEASLAALFQGSPAPVSVLFAGEAVSKVGQIRLHWFEVIGYVLVLACGDMVDIPF